MNEEIRVTLDEAENTVGMLRRLIEANDNGTTASILSSKYRDKPQSISLSNDPRSFEKYMSMSTVKLFQTQGSEVFQISGSVGLYFIVPHNRVRTAARSAMLRIVCIHEDQRDDRHPPAFLQVGDWVYPLTPGSMIYRSEHKYYLFPDLVSTVPGSSIGVILPQSCPPEQRKQFEDILLSLAGLEEFPSQPNSFGKSTELILGARTSISLVRTGSGVYSARSSQMDIVNNNEGYGKRIGAGLKAGGQLLSRGFELGALGTANALSLGTDCLKSSITKEENVQDVPPIIVNGVTYSRDLTGRVVDLTSSILATLSTMTSNLASRTACYVKTCSSPFVDQFIESTGIDPETLETITTEVKYVGEGIVDGTLAAYYGLEKAACIMANSLHSNTTDIITHCYGESAARVIDDAGEVVGNIAVTGINTNKFTRPKAIIYRTTKDAGIALAFADCGCSQRDSK